MSSMYPSYGGPPTQPCQRCGMPLPPNEVYCGNCGLYNAAPAQINKPVGRAQPSSDMSWGGPPPQASFAQTQYEGQQWGQPAAQPPPNAPFGGFSAPQRPFSTPGQPSSPNNYYSAPIQSSSPNNYYGAPAQPSSPSNFYGVSAPQQSFYPPSPPSAPAWGTQPGGMNGFQPTGFDELPEEPERGPRIGLIVGILILLVVLVGGGFGGYFYLNRHDNSTTITATPTLAPTPTPSGKPLFSDSFENNNYGWNLQGAPGKFSVKVGGGFMVLEDDDNKLLWELVPGGKTFNNFRLGVDAVLSKGTQDNGYGIYIRGASTQAVDLATYYRFELYGDGTFAVFKGTVDGSGNSTSSILVNYTVNAAILKQGSLNHIAITANGPKMTFMVNGQTVSTVSDNSYTSGSVALFVSNLKNAPPGAQATFSKLAIYPPANS